MDIIETKTEILDLLKQTKTLCLAISKEQREEDIKSYEKAKLNNRTGYSSFPARSTNSYKEFSGVENNFFEKLNNLNVGSFHGTISSNTIFLICDSSFEMKKVEDDNCMFEEVLDFLLKLATNNEKKATDFESRSYYESLKY